MGIKKVKAQTADRNEPLQQRQPFAGVAGNPADYQLQVLGQQGGAEPLLCTLQET